MARKPPSKPGRYCICRSRVLTSAGQLADVLRLLDAAQAAGLPIDAPA